MVFYGGHLRLAISPLEMCAVIDIVKRGVWSYVWRVVTLFVHRTTMTMLLYVIRSIYSFQIGGNSFLLINT